MREIVLTYFLRKDGEGDVNFKLSKGEGGKFACSGEGKGKGKACML